MKACEGRIGRVFVIRLEDGDVVPDCIERFAEEKGVSVGQAILVGGVGSGDVVVGPRRSEEKRPEPMLLPLDGAHEVRHEVPEADLHELFFQYIDREVHTARCGQALPRLLDIHGPR